MRPTLLYAASLNLALFTWGLTPVHANEIRDCPNCPVMITVPAGDFLMGTAVADRLIDPRTGKPATNDEPQHKVAFTQPFAIGKFEVTVAEYGFFVDATGHETTDRCMEFSKEDSFSFNKELSWDYTGFGQSPTQPVVCVSYFDAQAYAEWLATETGQNYRLPTESEWEYAARAGSTGPYYWGDEEAKACDYANVRSEGAYTISKRQAEADRKDGFPCDDGFTQSSPAGRFLPNALGLYDVQGNAWEWVIDCNHKDYVDAPADGSAWIDEPDAKGRSCQFAVIRSGSYLNLVERSSTTVRAGRPKTGGATNMGFRVARGAEETGTELEVQITGTLLGTDLSTPGARVFAENCAACHVEQGTYRGVYGKDQESVEKAIRDGGNNVMSMPTFGEVLTDEEIRDVATYVRELNGWK
jgi:formylglycine-generating enzyme required for sulfatase activity